MRKSKNPVKLGDIFGRLTVVAFLEKKYKNSNYIVCKCTCENIKTYSLGNLRRGTTSSCGCYAIEIHQKRTRKAPGEAMLNKWEKTYREGARKRNLVFELTKEEFRELIVQNCYLCGTAPIARNHHFNKQGERTGNKEITDEWAKLQTVYINGIDRLDNEIGYTKNNVIACCSQCNKLKNKSTLIDFLNHITKIINFSAGKF